METSNSHQIDVQVNAQPNEQAGSPVNDILAAATAATTLADTAKAMAADVVRPRRGSLTATYSDAGFEDSSEEYSPVGVAEATQHSTENLPVDFIEAATPSGRASTPAASSPATQATAPGSSHTDRPSTFSMERLQALIKQQDVKSNNITALLSETPVRFCTVRLQGGIPKQIKLGRAVNVEAALIQTCGTLAEKQCQHCKKGSGPFEGCFTVDGIASGACGNCHYNSEGQRCTFHSKSK